MRLYSPPINMASGHSVNLGYMSRPPRNGATRPAYLVSRLISAYIGYLLVMIVLALLVPKFQIVFSDSSIKLPSATLALLWVSQVCVRGYLWAIFLPLPALWAISTSNIADRGRRRRRFLTAFMFVAAFLSFSVLALLIPLTHLSQDVASR